MSGINKFIVQVPKNPQDIAAVWGRITGTITNQTDLVTYIGTRLADYVPYTGATSNVNLGIYNLKTSQVSLGTTATDGFILENATAATAGATVQISPRNRWRGTALATGVNTSQTYEFTAETLPISQATNIDGEFRIRSSRNGAAYVERFGVKTEGNDTKLKVGGVNYFGKAGNQNDFYSGTTSIRFLKNDASIIYMAINNTEGTVAMTPTTLSGSSATSSLSITQQWNTSGTPTAFKVSITDTASNASSLLADLIKGGTSQFSVNKNGGVSCLGQILTANSIVAGAAYTYSWNGRSVMASPNDGVIKLVDWAGTSFNRLQLGGTTSSFPALKRSSATLQARLADDSDYAEFTAKKLTTDTDIVTSDPGGGSGAWKLGLPQAAAVVLDDTQYIEINIDGTIYKLALAK